MKKIKFTYLIIMLVLLNSCAYSNEKANLNQEYDLGVVETFAFNRKIKYENEKEIDNQFLKYTYTEFKKVNDSVLNIEVIGLDKEVKLEQKMSGFNPTVHTNKVDNVNNFYIEYNKEKILDVSTKISQKYSILPIEPIINIDKINKGTIEFTESKTGKEINIEELNEKIYYALKNNEKYVKIEVRESYPKYKISDLREISEILGIFTTSVGNSSQNRIQNLNVASNSISNIIIKPNEIFSMSDVLGDLTYESGYVDAPVYINGVLTNDIAGGVCQVTSTLYNAVLLSELEVVERRNHSSQVNYVAAGLDATIAKGVIDFKFKNNKDYPIVILSSVTDGKVQVMICGKETRPTNRVIKFYSEKVKDVVSNEYDIVLDTNKAANSKEVILQPKNGSIYRVYKKTFVDGVELSKELINESYYKERAGKIVVGEDVYKEFRKDID